MTLYSFSDGEHYVQIDENVRGADVFIFAGDSGADAILDLDPLRDRLDLPGTGALSLTDTAEGTLVTFDDGRILLEGIGPALVTDALFV